RADYIDVLGLVASHAVLGDEQLTAGGRRRAVAVGQVVDHDRDDQRLRPVGRVLGHGLVQVAFEPETVGDGADPVQPDRGGGVGDVAHLVGQGTAVVVGLGQHSVAPF